MSSEIMNNINKKKDAINSIAECFFSLPPKQYAILSSVLGVLLVDDLDIGQQIALGSFIAHLGSAMLTAAAQRQQIESTNKKIDAQQLEAI